MLFVLNLLSDRRDYVVECEALASPPLAVCATRAETTALASDGKTMQTQTTTVNTSPATFSRVNQIFPITMIAVGFLLTVAWILLLGYGLVALIEFAI